jgi:hypothetical protein
MKERPILFSAPMVRVLLDGSKTQTRRVMKPQPEPTPDDYPGPAGHWWPCHAVQSMVHVEQELRNDSEQWGGFAATCCPHGGVGERLWVRETWGVVSNDWDDDGRLIDWVPDRPATEIDEMPFGQGYYSGHVIYAADGDYEWAGDDDGGGEPRSAWHPSIHMPRAACRILLEIVSVRVERLQDISEGDCLAEGIRAIRHEGDGTYYHYDHTHADPGNWCDADTAYQQLWESINGAGSWDANPWVWVLEFKRVQP